MNFHWNHKEANFGAPQKKEIDGGTHFSIEIILIYHKKYVAVRRPHGYPGHQLPPKATAYPQGCLYFCHDLPRWGETLDNAVCRIVKHQIGVGVQNMRVLDLNMETYPDEFHEGNRQWAITLYVLADLKSLPKAGKVVTEVVTFDISSIPSNMGWWEADEFVEFIEAIKPLP